MALPKTVKLYFSNGDLEVCLVRVDGNGEIVCYARDGRTAKFAAGDDDAFKAAVKRHNELNKGVPVLAEEAEAEDAVLAAWLSGDSQDGDAESDEDSGGSEPTTD